MTELELVLATLTTDELADADRYLGHLARAWRAMAPEDRRLAGLDRSDAPWHFLTAMRLALMREQALRYGADPWYAGMPLVDHPGAGVLRHYQERLTLNPDYHLSDRLLVSGALARVCPTCGVEKPLTVRFWAWADGRFLSCCAACSVSPAERAVAAELGLEVPG